MINSKTAATIAKTFSNSKQMTLVNVDFDKMVSDSVDILNDYTQLNVQNMPKPEILSRNEWIDMNIDSMSSIIDLIDKKMEKQINKKLIENNVPLAAAYMSKTIQGGIGALQIGALHAFLSQKVLGQVEAALMLPEDKDQLRLVFVGQNLEEAAVNMDIDRQKFFHWVCLHELTHVYQFAGVPWLKNHMREMIKEFISTLDAKLQEGFKIPSGEELINAYKEGMENGFLSLMMTPEQKELQKKLQATMSVIEGYAEHVMDAAGEQVLGDYKELRDRMQERRGERSQAEIFVMKLLGFDMKMKQYEEGRKFCNQIVETKDITFLNKVWDKPENLPTIEEIRDPALWIIRIEKATTEEAPDLTKE